MKAKYEKMIDEYVKKHYGDLERGVLAPEVKYKVLTKILKKKLKEKKSEVKVLRSLLKLYHITSGNDALMGPDESKVLPKEDGFDSLADGIKRYLRETCEECRYCKKGKDGEKDVCTKHDKFVTKTCSCYEFEDKTQKEMKTCDRCKYSTFKTVTNGREAATGKMWCTKNDFETSGVTSCNWFETKEDSYLDWLHDDITWCCRECSNMDCERNTMNRKMTSGLCSMADMFDPFKCPVDAEMPKQP